MTHKLIVDLKILEETEKTCNMYIYVNLYMHNIASHLNSRQQCWDNSYESSVKAFTKSPWFPSQRCGIKTQNAQI